MHRSALLVALLVFAAPAAAQLPSALYMTDEADGSDRLLSPDEPTGDPATLQFSPVADTPANTYDWVGDAQADDIEFSGDATVDLYFDIGADAASKTTVTLFAVDSSERELASAEDSTAGQIAPHKETFTLDLGGKVVREGEHLVLRISVTEVAVAVQLQYDGADTPSGITEIASAILDTDGDGFGDSAERRAGTDPDNATDTPDGAGGDPGDGSEDGYDDGTDGGSDDGSDGGTEPTNDADEESAPVEALSASFFLTICLALAGIALLGRYP